MCSNVPGRLSGPRLILVRHSLPEIVPSLPAYEWRLSKAGRRRCQALADRLATYHPDVIVTSVERKAIETGQIVADLLGKPVEMVQGLQEHDRSNVGWLGGEQFEAAVADFFRKPDELILGRETANQASQRFAAAIEGVQAVYPLHTVVAVTHGTVLSLFVARVGKLQPFRLWTRLGMPALVVLSVPGHDVQEVVERV